MILYLKNKYLFPVLPHTHTHTYTQTHTPFIVVNNLYSVEKFENISNDVKKHRDFNGLNINLSPINWINQLYI